MTDRERRIQTIRTALKNSYALTDFERLLAELEQAEAKLAKVPALVEALRGFMRLEHTGIRDERWHDEMDELWRKTCATLTAWENE